MLKTGYKREQFWPLFNAVKLLRVDGTVSGDIEYTVAMWTFLLRKGLVNSDGNLRWRWYQWQSWWLSACEWMDGWKEGRRNNILKANSILREILLNFSDVSKAETTTSLSERMREGRSEASWNQAISNLTGAGKFGKSIWWWQTNKNLLAPHLFTNYVKFIECNQRLQVHIHSNAYLLHTADSPTLLVKNKQQRCSISCCCWKDRYELVIHK